MDAFGQRDWDRLLDRIAEKRCTPFIGAGASASVFPVGAELARELATKWGYPLDDVTDLARVAQYVSVIEDRLRPKEHISRRFNTIAIPASPSADEPHQVLAALELPVYITTNYDGMMAQALRERGKQVHESICLWSRDLSSNLPSRFVLDPDYRPTPGEPLVYHLHGHLAFPESLVLTEDDYLDFLIRISKDETLLPGFVKESFTRASLLFVGYRIADWNFRVLFRNLVTYMEHAMHRSHFSVQSLPGIEESSEEERGRVQEYLIQYFDAQRISVFWGRSHEFAAELGRRWRASRDDG